MTAIVGASGSGKTALLKLQPGLYIPLPALDGRLFSGSIARIVAPARASPADKSSACSARAPSIATHDPRGPRRIVRQPSIVATVRSFRPKGTKRSKSFPLRVATGTPAAIAAAAIMQSACEPRRRPVR